MKYILSTKPNTEPLTSPPDKTTAGTLSTVNGYRQYFEFRRKNFLPPKRPDQFQGPTIILLRD